MNKLWIAVLCLTSGSALAAEAETCSVASPDGKLIVSVGPARAMSNGSLHILDAATKKELRVIKEHDPFITQVVWAGNNTYVLADGGSPEKRMAVYDVTAGKVVQDWLMKGDSLASSGIFSPNGKLLAVRADKNKVAVWSLAEPKQLHEVTHDSCASFAFSKDGAKLITTGADGKTREWDAVSGK